MRAHPNRLGHVPLVLAEPNRSVGDLSSHAHSRPTMDQANQRHMRLRTRSRRVARVHSRPAQDDAGRARSLATGYSGEVQAEEVRHGGPYRAAKVSATSSLSLDFLIFPNPFLYLFSNLFLSDVSLFLLSSCFFITTLFYD